MSEPGREIELKFHCAPQDLAAVLAAAPAGDDEVRELISVYFDTPDRALERAGVSLRVRESGGRRIQTLKRGKGLAREEHEQQVEGFAPDPDTDPLREILPPEEAAALSPAFYVGVHRRQRLVRNAEAEIEIALDHGEVRAMQGKSPISEVELELKAGPTAALFSLARELVKAAPLYLSFDSKSSVGQALTAGDKPKARRKAALSLSPGVTAAEAFQAVARNALAQVAANGQALREGADPEAVHQLRVAVRRLRSALSTFRPILTGDHRGWLSAELRWLAGSCSEVRELDVFAAGAASAPLDPAPPGLARLLDAVATRRAEAAGAVHGVVTSRRFRELLLEAAAWAETGDWLDDGAVAGLRDGPAPALAAATLERRLRTVSRAGKGRGKATDEAALHGLRLEAKKLRYGSEAFASLYPPKRVAGFLRPLKDLQAELGALNDAAVAERLAPDFATDVDTAFAAGELAGVSAAERPGRIARARKALKRLSDVRPFWA